MTVTDATELLAALVMGDAVPAEAWDAVGADFWSAAQQHGVLTLIAARLPEIDTAPSAIRRTAQQLLHQHVAADLLQEAELRRVLGALRDDGVHALLMKGASLAYTHYARPDFRPRLDTDILISVAERTAAHDILVALGYEADIQASTDLVMHQRAYVKHVEGVPLHVVDVHWRLANPEVFRQVVTFDEMALAAEPLPQLSAAARGISAVHALLVACVHRVAHHFDDDRLIWLYDIHLIATRLTPDDWQRFIALASDRRVATICRAGLRRSVERFGTSIPDMIWEYGRESLRMQAEVTASYLEPNRPHLRAVVDDLRALPSWSHRWRLLRDYAFPPSTYMREVYAPASATPLVWLYARRMFFGARKWLEHP